MVPGNLRGCVPEIRLPLPGCRSRASQRQILAASHLPLGPGRGDWRGSERGDPRVDGHGGPPLQTAGCESSALLPVTPAGSPWLTLGGGWPVRMFVPRLGTESALYRPPGACRFSYLCLCLWALVPFQIASCCLTVSSNAV